MSPNKITTEGVEESKETLIHVNIPMTYKFREECKKFAESLNLTMAGMVRTAILQYMKREQPNNQPQADILAEINNIKSMLSSKEAEKAGILTVLSKFTDTDVNKNEQEKLKGKILSILEDNPKGIHYNELAEKCGIKEDICLEILGQLQEAGMIYWKINKVLLVSK